MTEQLKLVLDYPECIMAIKRSAMLYQKTYGDRKHKAIFAVSRGGLVPAVMLSNWLNIPNVYSIQAKSYDDFTNAQGELILEMPTSWSAMHFSQNEILVVDDLVDTGLTFRAIRNLLPQATYFSIYKKPLGSDYVDICANECPQDTWIVFPWEKQ